MDSFFNDTILDIYDCIGNPKKFTTILDRFSEQFKLVGCNIFTIDSINQELNSALVSVKIQENVKKYLDDGIFELEKPLFDLVRKYVPPGKMISEKAHLDKITGADLESVKDLDKIHQWMQVNASIYDRSVAVLNNNNSHIEYLTFHYPMEYIGAVDLEQSFSRTYLPHLSKSIELARPLTMLQARYGTVFDVLDRLNIGIVLFDERCNIVLKNITAQFLATGRIF